MPNVPSNLDPLAKRQWLKRRRQEVLDDYERVLKNASTEDRDVSDEEQKELDSRKAEVEKIDTELVALEAPGDAAPLGRLTPSAHREETRPMRDAANPNACDGLITEADL
jgi:hypothetical protein